MNSIQYLGAAKLFGLFGILDPLFDILEDLFYSLVAVLLVDMILEPLTVVLYGFNKLLILVALLFAKFNELIVEVIFAPAFELLASRIQANLLPFVFTLAVFVLGITYVGAAFWLKDANLVDWKKAIAWLLAAILFYTAGVDLFRDSDTIRRGMSTVMYETLLDYSPGDCTTGITDGAALLGSFSGSGIGTDDEPIGCIRNFFGVPKASGSDPAWNTGDIGNDVSIDGIDVGLAYLLMDASDFWSTSTLPDVFEDVYFSGGGGGQARINDAVTGITRMFYAIFLFFFGIVEQFNFLMINIGMSLVFFMLLWGILLAFFTYTERVAMMLIQQWLSFMLLSLYVSILQGMAVFLVLLGATASNPVVPLAASILGLILVIVGAQTVTNVVRGMIQTLPQAFAMAVSGSAFARSSLLDKGTQKVSGGIAAPNRMAQMGMGGMSEAMGGRMGGGQGGGQGGGGMSANPTTGINNIVRPGASQGSGGMLPGGGGRGMLPGPGAAFPGSSGGGKGLGAKEGMPSSGGFGGGGQSGALKQGLSKAGPKGMIAAKGLEMVEKQKGGSGGSPTSGSGMLTSGGSPPVIGSQGQRGGKPSGAPPQIPPPPGQKPPGSGSPMGGRKQSITGSGAPPPPTGPQKTGKWKSARPDIPKQK